MPGSPSAKPTSSSATPRHGGARPLIRRRPWRGCRPPARARRRRRAARPASGFEAATSPVPGKNLPSAPAPFARPPERRRARARHRALWPPANSASVMGRACGRVFVACIVASSLQFVPVVATPVGPCLTPARGLRCAWPASRALRGIADALGDLGDLGGQLEVRRAGRRLEVVERGLGSGFERRVPRMRTNRRQRAWKWRSNLSMSTMPFGRTALITATEPATSSSWPFCSSQSSVELAARPLSRPGTTLRARAGRRAAA